MRYNYMAGWLGAVYFGIGVFIMSACTWRAWESGGMTFEMACAWLLAAVYLKLDCWRPKDEA